MFPFLLLAIVLAAVLPLQHSAEIIAKFNHAVELQRQGSFKEAEGEYRAILAAAPNYAEAHANLGAVLMRMNRYEEAIASYQSALRLAPNLSPILLNLGIAHYRQSDFDKAVETLKQFLKSNPDNIQAMQLVGLSLVELGRDAEAVEYLAQALSVAPVDPAVLYAIGLAYLRLQRSQLPDIIDRLSRTPEGLAAAHLLQGQSLLSRFEWENAIAELETAASLNANLPRLHYSLGLGYLKLGRHKDALTAFQTELRRAPKDFSTLYYLAYLHEAEGNLPAAREKLDSALALEPESAEANALLGKIFSRQGKATDAVKALKKAVSKDPGNPDKRYLLARAYQQVGRLDDANKQFVEVQRLKREQLEKDRARMPKP